METSNKPVTEIRIGMVTAAVWQNIKGASVWHNVTFERIYRDGDEWKKVDSFGRDDLLSLAKAADQVHTWILSEEGEVKGLIEEAKKQQQDVRAKTAELDLSDRNRNSA